MAIATRVPGQRDLDAPLGEQQVVNPLQKLIRDRLDELDLSQRGAAARSEGLLTAATINRILKGHHHQVTARAVSGLALALNLPKDRVAEAARETALPAQWDEVAKQFGGLSPKRQDEVMSPLVKMLDEQEAERAKTVQEERPYRKRKAR